MQKSSSTPGAEIRVSAVMPAHNEAENIEQAAGEIIEALSGLVRGFELIIVDDGSQDNTAELADGLSQDDPRVRVVRHQENLGYGAALRTGVQAARFEWIFFIDADLQFDAREIGKLLPLAGEHEFVAGFRAPRVDPWHRRLYGALFSRFVNLVFRVRAKDVNCAFKLFKSSILEGHEFVTTGALINTEILIAAKKRGIRPVQVPVSHLPRIRGEQSGGSPGVILRAGRELLKLMAGAGR